MEEGVRGFLIRKLGLSFARENLKDRLIGALNEVKTCTSNESNSDMANLQCEDVLVRLKQMDGHVTHIVLKCRQSVIERYFSTYSTLTTMDSHDLNEGPSCKRSLSQSPSPTSSDSL